MKKPCTTTQLLSVQYFKFEIKIVSNPPVLTTHFIISKKMDLGPLASEPEEEKNEESGEASLISGLRRNSGSYLAARQNENATEEQRERNVRPRVNEAAAATGATINFGLLPIDRSLSSHPVTTKTNPITIQQLMLPEHNLIPRQTRMDLQLLRVIANNNNNNNNFGPARVYGASRNTRNQSSNVNYSRLFLCRVVNKSEGNQLIYLMEARNSNNILWRRNPQLRDDGTVSIGAYFRILSPSPIKKLMANDIPLLETRFPAIVMGNAKGHKNIPVQVSIAGNESKAFVLTDCLLDVISSTPEETKCSGLFCDKQRIHEILDGNQGCGCYSMLSRRSNIVMDHSIHITNNNTGWECFVERFSSNRFSMFYQSGTFPSSLQSMALQMTDEYFKLTGCISDVVTKVNENGGWTVVGWYKRGMIDDKSMVNDSASRTNNNTTANETQVESGNLNYHICQIRPTKCETYENNQMGAHLFGLKYDMSNLSNN